MKIFSNRIILILVMTDAILLSAFAFISPIFSLFIIEDITGGTVKIVGFAAAIYLGTKSIFQIFVARFLDKNKGEYKHFYALLLGTFIVSMGAFGYYIADSVLAIFILQVFMGIGDALNVPSYLTLYTRHIDRGKEAREWTARSVAVGLGTAGAGALSGILATTFGFRPIFIIIGVLSLIATFLTFTIRKYLCVPKEENIILPILK